MPLLLTQLTAIAQCVIDVMIDGPLVRANWYDIWGSAVMNVAMCARFGKSGVSFGRGRYEVFSAISRRSLELVRSW